VVYWTVGYNGKCTAWPGQLQKGSGISTDCGYINK